MTPLLADTSVWVEYLRDGADTPSGRLLAPALQSGDALLCGPVAAELLAGTSARDRERLSETLLGLEWVDLGRSDWLAVGRLAAELRAAGATVPLTDLEIAVAAISAGAQLATVDSDFERIAAVESKLRLLSPHPDRGA